MASKTLFAHSFPAGTVVSAYLRDQLVNGGPPSGVAVSTATVASDGSLTFSGLSEGQRYVAWASSRAVSFFMEDGSSDTLKPFTGVEAQGVRGRLESVESSTVRIGPTINTADILQGKGGYVPDGSGIPNIGGPWTLPNHTGGLYADSGSGNLFQLASYAYNTGSRATVALFGFGKGNHVWGANLIGYTSGVQDGDTAIGIEINAGILGNPNTGIAYSLLLANKGGRTSDGLPNAGPYIQMQASTNAETKYGIRTHKSGSVQAVDSTGTLWLNDSTQTHAIGLDWSGTTFTDAAIKLSAGSAIKIGTSTLKPSRADRNIAAFLAGLGWFAATASDPAPYSTSTALPASGTLYAAKLPLLAGDVVTSLSAVCSSIGSGVTGLWYVLLDPSRVVKAFSPNLASGLAAVETDGLMTSDGTTATPITAAADGDYYHGFLAVYTTTAPAFRGLTSSTAYTNLSLARSGNSSTGLSAPPSVGSTASAITGNAAILLGGAK